MGRLLAAAAVLLSAVAAFSQTFDESSNGYHTSDLGVAREHDDDRHAFDEVDDVAKGLGPLYNAQSCRECHQNPISGGSSQVMVKRAVVRQNATVVDPDVTLDDGKVVPQRNLINDRAICAEEQERVPDVAGVHTTNRTSLSVLGDGLLEAVPDADLKALSDLQCAGSDGICGAWLYVPVLELDGVNRIGRFGWKDQHASLLSFSADAYFNEVGITSDLFPDELFAGGCDHVADPEDKLENGMRDIDRFARFMRASRPPPPRSAIDFDHPSKGLSLFRGVGCAKCHVETLTTAPVGTRLGSLVVDSALGGQRVHPFSDLLLHDVGTGDGIPIAVDEHYGRSRSLRGRLRPALGGSPGERSRHVDDEVNHRGGRDVPPGERFSFDKVKSAANKLRTPPLWGVRTHARLMHDGASLTMSDAVKRHKGEAEKVRKRFDHLSSADQRALLDFVLSL